MDAIFDQLREQLLHDGPRYVLALLRIAFIILAAVLLLRVARRLTERFVGRIGLDGDAARRVQTIMPMLLSVERFTIWFIAVVLALGQLGIDTSAILAGAGVMGLAVGFGAQNLVKDMISGFFLILDGNISSGDFVNVGGQMGLVEGIGLRNTILREFNGRLWAVPNGDIRILSNWSHTFARAVVQVGIAYEDDVERALDVLRRVVQEWSAANPGKALEAAEVDGILEFEASAVALRAHVKVLPGDRGAVERELRVRIKRAFDAAGIEIPYQKIVWHRPRPVSSAEAATLDRAAG